MPSGIHVSHLTYRAADSIGLPDFPFLAAQPIRNSTAGQAEQPALYVRALLCYTGFDIACEVDSSNKELPTPSNRGHRDGC
jgi:hypothetical protein